MAQRKTVNCVTEVLEQRSLLTTVTSSLRAPDIAVWHDGTYIPDGALYYPDGTDFGSLSVGDASPERTYRVANRGDALLLTSGLVVPEGFAIVEGLNGSIPAGGYDDFTVRLKTDTIGRWNGEISFTTNDSDKNPFEFPITGSVEAWLPYIPTAGQTSVTTIKENGKTLVTVDVTVGSSGFRVVDWGLPTLSGNVFAVDATFEQWTGGSATVITHLVHTYDLGPLAPGEYVFDLDSGGQDVVSEPLVVSGLWEIAATPGDDVISLSLVGSDYRLQVGNDVLTRSAATVSGFVIRGGAGNDSIAVAADVLTSATIWGGAGNDTVVGGGGADWIAGMDGADQLRGGPGSDTMYGGWQADVLAGGGGDDALHGGRGADAIYGGYGNDLLVGENGNDSLRGGDGQDTLSGGAGADLLSGEAGNDRLFSAGDGMRDLVSGGAGTDYLWRDALDGELEVVEQVLII